MFSKLIKLFNLNKSSDDNSIEQDKSNSEINNVDSVLDNKEKRVELINTLIIDTDLSTRTINCLLANGIDTIDKLVKLDLAEFKQTSHNVGQKTVDEIKAFLSQIKVVDYTTHENVNKPIKNETIIIDSADTKEIDERVFAVEIKNLDLSERLLKALQNSNIITLGDFLGNKENISLKPKESQQLYEKIKKYSENKET